MVGWNPVDSRIRVVSGRQANVGSTKRRVGGAWVDVASHDRNAGVTPPQPTGTMLIGLRTKDSVNATTAEQRVSWTNAVNLFGPMNISRGEYWQTLPSTPSYFTDSSVVQMASFKSIGASPHTALTSWAQAVRLPALLTYHHEPEAPNAQDYGANGGDTFKAEFRAAYDAIKAANPDVQLGMAAGGFQYRTGNNGADGNYIPAADKCDFYGFDTYRNGDSASSALVGLAQVGEFQNWYGYVKDKGKPLFITEYGRGWQNTPGTPGSWTQADKDAADAARPQLMKDDYLYLKGLGFAGIIYWWNSNSPGDDWKFTDQDSIDALTWIAAQEVT